VIQQAIRFGDLPVGLVRALSNALSLHYIEADTLGAPRLVIEPSGHKQGMRYQAACDPLCGAQDRFYTPPDFHG
jgi:hypothetical protein